MTKNSQWALCKNSSVPNTCGINWSASAVNEVGLNWFIQSLEPNASSFGINLLHTSLINIIHISVILSLRFFYVKIVNLVLNFLTTFLGVLCDLQRKVSRWFLTGFSSSKKNCFPKDIKYPQVSTGIKGVPFLNFFSQTFLLL